MIPPTPKDVQLASDGLRAVGVPGFTLRINHRKILKLDSNEATVSPSPR
jgi:histidyl-tRNA synthetase